MKGFSLNGNETRVLPPVVQLRLEIKSLNNCIIKKVEINLIEILYRKQDEGNGSDEDPKFLSCFFPFAN